MTVLGMCIQYEDYCVEHAKWQLESAGLVGREIDVIMRKRSDGLFSTYYNNMPVRYIKGEKYTVKWDEKEQCYYRHRSVENELYRVIGSVDIDIEEASKRTYGDEMWKMGIDRINELDPIYLTKIDDKIVVVDKEYARKNEDSVHLLLKYQWNYSSSYIEKVLNKVLEADGIDFYFSYTYQSESEYLDGVTCYHGCTVLEPYHTTCQCDGCKNCDKSHEGKDTGGKIDTRKCSRHAAYGRAAEKAETGYNTKQQLCKECQLAELENIDDIVLDYLDSLYSTASTEQEKAFYSDVISSLRSQYSFFLYDKFYARETDYDISNDTPIHKVIEIIRTEHDNIDIDVDRLLFYQNFGREREKEGCGKEDEYFAIPTKIPVKEAEATQVPLFTMPE